MFLSLLLTEATPQAAAWVKGSGDELDFASRVDLTLILHGEGNDFGELTRRVPSLTADHGELHVGSPSQAISHDAPTDSHKSASFLIDFEEPSIAEAARAVSARYGASPTAEQIEEFTYGYVERKTYTHGFDVASQVAGTRSGDCTEHAVLLVALLRRFGIPARVVMGLALIGVDERLISAGHAWAEYHREDAWRRLDAALYSPPAGGETSAHGVPGLPAGATLRRAYLPMHVLTDEGLGFKVALLQTRGLLHVKAVKVGLLDPQRP